MDEMIAVRHLTKRFGPTTAVDDVSFAVSRGEVLGFLGPNGAGKSTTMKMITGFLAPTSGTAVICGCDIREAPIAAKRHIGYLPEGRARLSRHDAAELPALHRQHPRLRRRRGAAADRSRGRANGARQRAGTSRSRRSPRASSAASAWRRRCCTIPTCSILDEPTDGLDPNQKHEVRAPHLAPCRRRRSSSRPIILEEVDAVCTRAIVIAQGRVLADGTPGELEARSRHHNAVRLALAQSGVDAATALLRLARRRSVEPVDDAEDGALMIFPRDGHSIVAEVADLVRTAGWSVAELRVERGRLDDVFRAITLPRA